MSDDKRRKFPVDLSDVLGFAGAGSVTYGVWLMHQPTAFIVGGSLMLSISVIGAVAKARK
ncbi:hypothetical protein CDO28_01885 [Sinorhizobium meliloti]|uniref:hypothetical protein n=1 Tax=Rhizobium meliloti TaxID=382 RepID=UPI000B4A0BCD|nr:hypothetical protein [Sinorhizobium meliloti]ASP70428.1 hypothetical protein CDO28_01885 [Sinorhizobium meliloti]MDE3854870.1 hypothetical protein [Sinorhizobium meliloti]MQW52545.1 hypothetical protein [Sinorhizobium meliloti]